MEQTTKIAVGIGVFLTIASGLLFIDITPDDKIYSCLDKDLVGFCFKLSNVNSDGFQTRCYYNESAPTRYKTCSTGWEIFTTGIIESSIEPIIIPLGHGAAQERCNQINCTPII